VRATKQLDGVVKRVPAGDLGTVVVGFTAASAHVVLPLLFDAAREKLPDVKLDLREMVTSVQLEALMSGELASAWRARRSGARVWCRGRSFTSG
jgi:hypothetical protein